MNKILLSLAASTIALASFGQCTDLYFSEYIEGSSNNKAFEIYNPTNAAIDLSTYSVGLFANGASTANSTLNLTGTLNAGGVYVIVHSSANATLKAFKDTIHGVCNYNGDDALVLSNGGTQIDIIGVVGVDPGTNWPVGTGSTVDHTLVRKAAVNKGNTTWTGSADTEWDVYAVDDFSFIGSHTADGCGTLPTPLAGGITLSEDTVCVGTTITYTATVSGGTAPYTTVVNFGDGNTSTTLTGSHTYATAGTYTLVYTATGSGVSESKDSTISVLVNTCQTAPLVGGITLSEDTVCVGTTITYTATVSGGTAPYTTVVNFGDGNTSTTLTGSHTYATAGTYTLVYTATGSGVSESKDSTISVLVNTCTAIDEIKENAISIYPNPSKNGLVNLTNVANNATVTVYNVIGEVVFSTVVNGKEQLNLSSLNKGSYFVAIASNKGLVTKKLILE